MLKGNKTLEKKREVKNERNKKRIKDIQMEEQGIELEVNIRKTFPTSMCTQEEL
jgi:hypothetical protein